MDFFLNLKNLFETFYADSFSTVFIICETPVMRGNKNFFSVEQSFYLNFFFLSFYKCLLGIYLIFKPYHFLK